MATITLRKDKINGVGGLIDSIVKSSNNLNTQLGTLRNTLQGVDSSTCDLQNVVDSISSLSKSEKEKVADLKRLNSKLTDFITEGAFSGAISGAITGAACAGLGALGGAAGNFVKCGSAFGKFVKSFLME